MTQTAAGKGREDGPVSGADQDENIPRRSKATNPQGDQIAFGNHEQNADGSHPDPGNLGKGKFFMQKRPTQQGHENGGGCYDPGGRGGLRTEQPGGLQPLVEGNAEKAQQGEV